LRKVYMEFRKSIAGTAPCMRPWVEGDTKIDEEELIKLSKEGENGLLGDSGEVFYLDEVLKLANEARTRELPGNTPFDVKAHLINLFVMQWRALTEICFNQAESLIADRLSRVVSNLFDEFSHNGLNDIVLTTAQQYLSRLGVKTLAQLENILELEKLPYTLDEEYLQEYKRKMTTHYENLYNASIGHSLTETALNVGSSAQPTKGGALQVIVGELRKQVGYEHVKINDLSRLQPPNEALVAIEIMAEARAYFQVAYRRVSDNVALQIDRTLIREFGQCLRSELLERLGIFTEDGRDACARWMAEDPVATERRKDLSARKTVLSAAMRKLQSLH